ncbi:hypothetical protein GCM10011348_45910 [Marinobacterium nitratireducens]|uniref:Terminase n=1 Tax=Marinobacterium nitratireducens TaxID=518897 RepID=A0A917ZRS3_9GAMM|nr:helix-turn-helix domain-containing protein [Marinobacterium nitratireducens]GGO89055.1 hypothetical protein GCM10011348_45910 [Marinobacterium nitratireducens]
MARPTRYKAEFAEQARKLCLLGATDKDLADFFEVAETTIDNWKKAHAEFMGSIKSGKQLADATVADRLYKRATGYEHDAVKIFNNGGEEMVVPYTERYAPDTTAAIFWLKNRQPEKWRDKQHVDHTSNGETIKSFSEMYGQPESESS